MNNIQKQQEQWCEYEIVSYIIYVLYISYEIMSYIWNYVWWITVHWAQLLSKYFQCQAYPDSKVHGANMGPIWGQQDPGGPHVGPLNFAIWVALNPSGAVRFQVEHNDCWCPGSIPGHQEP